MNIFEFNDYKQALKQLMKQRRAQFGSRYTFQKMADSCGFQKTYLSKVINHDGNLSSEQLFKAATYLKLSPIEVDYILLLRERDLALDKDYKNSLDKKIIAIKKAKLKTETVISTQTESLTESEKVLYYTNTELQMLHLFMTIPEFRQAPYKIAPFIGVTKLKFDSLLLTLQKLNFITYENGQYTVNDPKLHLSEDSPIYTAYSVLNRMKTLEKLRATTLSENNDYYFSVFLSAETSFQVQFKKKLLKFLAETQDEVINSQAKEVYQLNIDFLKWS